MREKARRISEYLNDDDTENRNSAANPADNTAKSAYPAAAEQLSGGEPGKALPAADDQYNNDTCANEHSKDGSVTKEVCAAGNVDSASDGADMNECESR